MDENEECKESKAYKGLTGKQQERDNEDFLRRCLNAEVSCSSSIGERGERENGEWMNEWEEGKWWLIYGWNLKG